MSEHETTFLGYACWDHETHGRGDYRLNEAATLRLLALHPELARGSLCAAVVCGEMAEVERILSERPAAAREPGGPRQWPPLLYLCYGRVDLPAARDNAVAIARLLLDHGADPNAWYPAGDSRYSALVGVAGEGEQDASRHPAAADLYRLLLERGAGPYDTQVLYNTHFHGDVQWWLEPTYEYCVRTGREADWKNPDWPMLDMGGYGSGARFLLWIALEKRNLDLARWLLERGANPNAAPASDPRHSKRSLYEDALRLELPEIAALLLQHGAEERPLELSEEEAFFADCFRLNLEDAAYRLHQFPEFLFSTNGLFVAARADRPDVIELLEELGVPLELENARRQRVLHEAAAHNALKTARFLLERGVEIDPRESNWDATPLGFASHHQHQEMIELLAGKSRDIWNLVFNAQTGRLREVLAQQPDLARIVSKNGFTPLWWLPEDEQAAAACVSLLISHGADPAAVAQDGSTAAAFARKRGMERIARVLETPEAYSLNSAAGRARPRRPLRPEEWDSLAGEMKSLGITGLDAHGMMTDAVLNRLTGLEQVTSLDLSGSRGLTDAGLAALAGMPQLRRLALNGCPITDRGLEVLRKLPELRYFQLCHHRGITDAGAAHLEACPHLEHVELMNTSTGDGVLRALAGKPALRHLKAGNDVTAEGLDVLREYPVFRTWQGGDERLDLMSYDGGPNFLWLFLRAPHLNGGLARLAGLDGLFGLSVHGGTDHGPFEHHDDPVTPVDLSRLAVLPRLGFLGCAGDLCDDAAMQVIGGLPRLRMLMGQGTVATDAGFESLGRSASLEYFWGRECPHLSGRGFRALASIPSLLGLAVSCKNVDDEALALLPRSRALRELMPMDFADSGFRHAGRCENLEALWCMYCRETGDAATAHIAALPRLATYYAGKTKITDRSLEILGRMDSLERLMFWHCEGLTDAGVAHLARLPKLRAVEFQGGMPRVTPAGMKVFRPGVRVDYSI